MATIDKNTPAEDTEIELFLGNIAFKLPDGLIQIAEIRHMLLKRILVIFLRCLLLECRRMRPFLNLRALMNLLMRLSNISE